MNVMQEMQKIAPEIVPICRKITGFRGGSNVDIVGVTGSIPVTPTIFSMTYGHCTYFSSGSTNLEGAK